LWGVLLGRNQSVQGERTRKRVPGGYPEGIHLKANRRYFGTSARALTGEALDSSIINGVQTKVNILL
jgi:hypothetical protein